MKILHLFNEIKFSGAEIMYRNATPVFKQHGADLIAFSTGAEIGAYSVEFEKAGIKTHHKPLYFEAFSIKGFRYYRALYIFLKNEKIDVLHIHRSSLYFAAIVAWLANVRCIKTMHNTFKNRWFTLHFSALKRYLIKTFFKTIFHTIGESVYLNELNYYKNSSFRVNNWFDQSKFYPANNVNERLTIRRKLNLEDDSFVIISVGGCTHVKNHHDIIKAVSELDKTVNFYYLHLGVGESEQEERELAEHLGVSHRVRFLGNQVDVRDYLISSDVFVMTSKFEGLAISALEAMACELPLIFYNAPGLRDLIKDDDNGFLIDSDYRLLLEKIRFYQTNPFDMRKKGKNALEFVNKEFSMLPNVKKIMDLYKR